MFYTIKDVKHFIYDCMPLLLCIMLPSLANQIPYINRDVYHVCQIRCLVLSEINQS